MAQPWTLTARWLIPIDGPPLPRGTLTIEGERIVVVEPHGQRTPDRDLGNVAVLPGFVNAHTHLDLSGMRGKCPPTPDFTQWLRQVISHRRGQTVEQIGADIDAGFRECQSCGTTLLGDICAMGLSSLILAYSPLRLIGFYEMLGLPMNRANAAWDTATDRLAHHRASPTCRAGLSPHAPYSVCSWLFQRTAEHAASKRLTVAIHLAETVDELELMQEHRGSLVPFLTELGVWHPQGLVESPRQIIEMFRGDFPVLFIHCNHLDPATPIPPNATIVYCPRTHAAFGHPPHPFREFLRRGVRVALGTDSLASNPDLDILAEARFVHRHYPDVPAADVLRMMTLSGAEALGWEAETGSLTPGKSADLVVLPLPNEDGVDPCTLVLQSANSVSMALFRGGWTMPNP